MRLCPPQWCPTKTLVRRNITAPPTLTNLTRLYTNANTHTHIPCPQIFSAYTEKYTIEVSTCLDDKMRVWLQGRKVTPQVYLRQGPFLSWSGFEAVCQDFSIATTTAAIGVMSRTKAAGVTGSASSPHHHHHNNNNSNINSINHSRHSTQGALPSDHQRPPRTSPAFLAVKGACRPDSDTTGVLSTQTPSGSLLSGVQACIAFVSACTQEFAVASFPSDDGGSGNSDAGDGSVKKLPSQIYCGDSTDKGGKRTSDNEDDAAYWRVSGLAIQKEILFWGTPTF